MATLICWSQHVAVACINRTATADIAPGTVPVRVLPPSAAVDLACQNVVGSSATRRGTNCAEEHFQEVSRTTTCCMPRGMRQKPSFARFCSSDARTTGFVSPKVAKTHPEKPFLSGRFGVVGNRIRPPILISSQNTADPNLELLCRSCEEQRDEKYYITAEYTGCSFAPLLRHPRVRDLLLGFPAVAYQQICI